MKLLVNLLASLVGNMIRFVTGNKAGNLQTLVSCAGLSASRTIPLSGSAGPSFSISAPVALAGTISSGTVTLGANATFAGTEKVGIFWTVAGVAYQRLGCTISSGTATTTYTVSGGSGTSLPTGGTSILVATAQDITDGVSMVGSSLQQLLITSSQPGAVELLDVTPAVQRTSTITAAGEFDTWPTAAGQSVPFSATVLTIRCYNNSLSVATMQCAFIAA